MGSRTPFRLQCEFCLGEFSSCRKNFKLRKDQTPTCKRCVGTRNAYRKSGSSLDKHEFWKTRRSSAPEHVLVQETLERFGYSELNVFSRTSVPVLCKCEFCHSTFEATLISLNLSPNARCNACVACSMKYVREKSSLPKREFWESWKKRELETQRSLSDRLGILASSGSDKLINATCDFCLKSFAKRIKYINFKTGSVTCQDCSSLSSGYRRVSRTITEREYYLEMRPVLDSSVLNVQMTLDEFGYDPTLPFDRVYGTKLVVKCCFCGGPVRTNYSYFVKKKMRVTCVSCRRRKASETLISRYGVPSPLMLPSMQNPLTERIVSSILTDRYKVEFVRNYSIPITDIVSYSFDFYVPSCNLLIECQGDYFHDFKANGYSGTPKDRAKASWVENFTTMKLVHIWEHEIHAGRVAKILSRHVGQVLEPEVVVASNKDLEFCHLSNSEAHAFLSIHHYLGNLGTVATCYGVKLDGVLICVAAFGGTTRVDTFKKVNRILGSSYGSKELKELRRFCIRPNVRARRMASFCLRRFVQLYQKDFPATLAVIGFSDPTVGDSGSVYEYSGWKSIQKTVKSYHYLDPSTLKMIHKKTVWDMAINAHMKEQDFAAKSGLRKVGDMPKHVWIKVL